MLITTGSLSYQKDSFEDVAWKRLQISKVYLLAKENADVVIEDDRVAAFRVIQTCRDSISKLFLRTRAIV